MSEMRCLKVSVGSKVTLRQRTSLVPSAQSSTVERKHDHKNDSSASVLDLVPSHAKALMMISNNNKNLFLGLMRKTNDRKCQKINACSIIDATSFVTTSPCYCQFRSFLCGNSFGTETIMALLLLVVVVVFVYLFVCLFVF